MSDYQQQARSIWLIIGAIVVVVAIAVGAHGLMTHSLHLPVTATS